MKTSVTIAACSVLGILALGGTGFGAYELGSNHATPTASVVRQAPKAKASAKASIKPSPKPSPTHITTPSPSASPPVASDPDTASCKVEQYPDGSEEFAVEGVTGYFTVNFTSNSPGQTFPPAQVYVPSSEVQWTQMPTADAGASGEPTNCSAVASAPASSGGSSDSSSAPCPGYNPDVIDDGCTGQ